MQACLTTVPIRPIRRCITIPTKCRATPKGEEDLWSPVNVSTAWKRRYFDRIKDLIDHYEPDLMYIDGPIFFEEIGLSLVAHQYNLSAKKHGGVPQTVYTSKRREDSEVGTCVLDIERGVVDTIWPRPWQTDTCVGQWHYNKGQKYKSAKLVIDMLVDIVSRNGNLMLNFPLNSKGELDADELKVLEGVTRWMAVNSEGIYATRPWKIFGYGPATAVSAYAGTLHFNENQRKNLSAADVRFTKKGDTLYAFCMGLPGPGGRDRAAGHEEPAEPRQSSSRRTARRPRRPEIQAGRNRPAHRPAVAQTRPSRRGRDLQNHRRLRPAAQGTPRLVSEPLVSEPRP